MQWQDAKNEHDETEKHKHQNHSHTNSCFKPFWYNPLRLSSSLNLLQVKPVNLKPWGRGDKGLTLTSDTSTRSLTSGLAVVGCSACLRVDGMDSEAGRGEGPEKWLHISSRTIIIICLFGHSWFTSFSYLTVGRDQIKIQSQTMDKTHTYWDNKIDPIIHQTTSQAAIIRRAGFMLGAFTLTIYIIMRHEAAVGEPLKDRRRHSLICDVILGMSFSGISLGNP